MQMPLRATSINSGAWRTSFLTVFAVATLAFWAPASAQDYPNKPIKLVLPYPPGVIDPPARLLADRLSQVLGQPIIVENRPGAGGGVGAASVAKSPADGYTLLFAGGGLFTVNPTLYKTPIFNRGQFEPVAVIGETGFVFIARKDLPANSMKDLAALLKKEPGKVKYGKISHGSQFHLMWEKFAADSQATYSNVTLQGTTLLPALLAGDVDVTTMTILPMFQYLENGQLKPLAVSGPKRQPRLPQTPTFTEAGYPELDLLGDYYLMAPKGTPKPVIDRLVKEINTLSKDPAYIEALSKINVTPSAIDSPAGFNTRMTQLEKIWGDMVKRSGIVIE